MFDLVIRNGRLVSPAAITPGTIGVSDGSIAAIASPGEQITCASEIDATGTLILPGLVDAHVHIPGFLLSSRLDDFTSASKAAAAGGVTTVLLMAAAGPRTATPFYFEQKRDSGVGRSYIDYALQAIVGPMSESIDDLAALGAVSFELFLA